jgi:hypothetical protein
MTPISAVVLPAPLGSPAEVDPIIGLAWLVGSATVGLLVGLAIRRYRMLRHPLVQAVLALRVGTLMMFVKMDKAMGVSWPERTWTRIVLAALRAQLRISTRRSLP